MCPCSAATAYPCDEGPPLVVQERGRQALQEFPFKENKPLIMTPGV
jgi:hypothetical protein